MPAFRGAAPLCRGTAPLCRGVTPGVPRRQNTVSNLWYLAAIGVLLLAGVATGCSTVSTEEKTSSTSILDSSRSREAAPSSKKTWATPPTSTPPTDTAVGDTPALKFTVLKDFDLISYRDVLAHARALEVKGRAPKTGYTRAEYGKSWSDNTTAPLGHNGCRTREDILHRDLVNVRVRPGSHGCVVETGTLLDPYTGKIVYFQRGETTSALVQIDHVVALADSWVKGAQYWPFAKRLAFANDPRNLLAVSGWVNSQKRAGDTATWLPPNKAYRCEYVARQVEVKRLYGLWVTQAEQAAMISVLQHCRISPSLG